MPPKPMPRARAEPAVASCVASGQLAAAPRSSNAPTAPAEARVGLDETQLSSQVLACQQPLRTSRGACRIRADALLRHIVIGSLTSAEDCSAV